MLTVIRQNVYALRFVYKYIFVTHIGLIEWVCERISVQSTYIVEPEKTEQQRESHVQKPHAIRSSLASK